ncbi:hypothetical protein DLJ53_09340 [Acuticoccus sediminis]|uniref:CopL family metal-binding regulatory protein n=1 Tax=Acuticoccus sediminis TaxID=2184697 RepID=A0A8B2NV61_9HYPH|nr:hypothetical protein [Acuticoccus sediminis]RAI01613.1 hypothetical protein DLJ53_09340 [Acuticoccus sediminis]
MSVLRRLIIALAILGSLSPTQGAMAMSSAGHRTEAAAATGGCNAEKAHHPRDGGHRMVGHAMAHGTDDGTGHDMDHAAMHGGAMQHAAHGMISPPCATETADHDGSCCDPGACCPAADLVVLRLAERERVRGFSPVLPEKTGNDASPPAFERPPRSH